MRLAMPRLRPALVRAACRRDSAAIALVCAIARNDQCCSSSVASSRLRRSRACSGSLPPCGGSTRNARPGLAQLVDPRGQAGVEQRRHLAVLGGPASAGADVRGLAQLREAPVQLVVEHRRRRPATATGCRLGEAGQLAHRAVAQAGPDVVVDR